MLVTITNTSGLVLNTPDVHDGGSGAVGGAKVRALPHPFSAFGALAIAGTKQLPVHPADFRFKRSSAETFEANTEMNALIQKSYLTVAFAGQPFVREYESLSINTI